MKTIRFTKNIRLVGSIALGTTVLLVEIAEYHSYGLTMYFFERACVGIVMVFVPWYILISRK